MLPKNKHVKLCLALFVGLLLCELIIRIFFLISNTDILFYASRDGLLYERHPFLEYTLRPNIEINQPNAKLQINSLGFRGKEFDPEDKRPFRVFVLGGSSVFGRLEMDNPPFCELLENKLKEKYPDRDIEIVNAGVSGYTSFHSLINLSTRLLDYNPKAIIIYHSWNDIKIWPYISRECDYGRQWQKFYSKQYSLNALKTLLNNSYTWLLIKAVRRDILHRFFPMRKHKLLQLSIEKSLKANEGDDTTYGESVYKRNIEDIIAVAKKNKIQVLLINPLTLIHPGNSNKEKQFIDVPLHVSPEKLPQLMNEVADILKEIASSEHVQYLDLNKHIKQNLANLNDHIHLTPKGNEAVASYLAQQWDQIWGQDN